MIRHQGNVMDVITENDKEYQFFPVSCGSVQFKVRAKHDAHLALTTGAEVSVPMYEVFIGGWGNSKSIIRKDRKTDIVEAATPDILDKDEFRSFWVRWDNGTISAGRESEPDHFLTWTDPDPIPVAFVGVCTGWGATGTWQIEDGDEFDTPNKLEYIFRPVTTGYLQFEFRGPSNAQICLSNEPIEGDSTYEFVLGEKNNNQSVIRRRKQTQDEATKQTPGLLHPNEFRSFVVQWTNGRLVARDGTPPGKILLDWVDRSPFPITHFGVGTRSGARGHWRISHFPGSEAPANQILPPVEEADTVKWVGASRGEVPPGAIVGGRDSSGEPLYVARAIHKSAIIPGKLAKSKPYACVSWGGNEYAKSQYMVLVGGSNTWIATSGGNIPANALPAGRTEDGEPLYVGRVTIDGGVVVGKVQKSHSVCYVPLNGLEVSFPEYEILLE